MAQSAQSVRTMFFVRILVFMKNCIHCFPQLSRQSGISSSAARLRAASSAMAAWAEISHAAASCSCRPLDEEKADIGSCGSWPTENWAGYGCTLKSAFHRSFLWGQRMTSLVLSSSVSSLNDWLVRMESLRAGWEMSWSSALILSTACCRIRSSTALSSALIQIRSSSPRILPSSPLALVGLGAPRPRSLPGPLGTIGFQPAMPAPPWHRDFWLHWWWNSWDRR